MKKFLHIILFVSGLTSCTLNDNTKFRLKFNNKTVLPHTYIKDQGQTQTCWAYAMTSFIESEILINRADTVHLSPMYIARQKYLNQFKRFYDSSGTDEIRDGSLGHSMLNIWKENGLMPYDCYHGRMSKTTHHNHRRLLKGLRKLAKEAVKKQDFHLYRNKIEQLLDKEMGEMPDTFLYQGATYTPRSFAEAIGLKADKYIELTSFTHQPFYDWIVLNLPDNWEKAPFYNVPIDQLEACVKQFLSQGRTVVWDGDISEKGFSARYGVAIYPHSPVGQAERQKGFENSETTDDHMMHIVGTAYDDSGKFYYILKNSWGKKGAYQGLIYMSADYFRAKTISVVIPMNHKISKAILRHN